MTARLEIKGGVLSSSDAAQNAHHLTTMASVMILRLEMVINKPNGPFPKNNIIIIIIIKAIQQ